MRNDSNQEKAERYRVRAEEIRMLAESDKSHATYEALMQIAADYEKMAQSAEVIAASKKALRED